MADIKRYKMESDQNWREWVNKMPAIKFDPEWSIKIIPPFGGAMVRFCAVIGDKSASVYLDVDESLGYFGEPYWEVYPVDGDIARCRFGDIEQLLSFIRSSLA